MRDKLNTEITRKQFLQYMAGAVLVAFGLGNLFSLLTGGHFMGNRMLGGPDARSDFGSRSFGN